MVYTKSLRNVSAGFRAVKENGPWSGGVGVGQQEVT